MRITVIYILLFYANALFAQHTDTIHLKNNTVILTAYDDARIISQGDRLLDQNMIKQAIEKYTIVVGLSPANKTAITNRAFHRQQGVRRKNFLK